MYFLGTGLGGKHLFRCPEDGCHLKGRMGWSRCCGFALAEKPDGTNLRMMGILHRVSKKWREIFRRRPCIERDFSSNKHFKLLDKHQYLGQRLTPAI